MDHQTNIQDRTTRTLSILGASLWILGLILFIVGLNIHNTAGSWMTTIGSIAFLIGLGLEGYLWLRRRGEQRDASGKEQ